MNIFLLDASHTTLPLTQAPSSPPSGKSVTLCHKRYPKIHTIKGLGDDSTLHTITYSILTT